MKATAILSLCSAAALASAAPPPADCSRPHEDVQVKNLFFRKDASSQVTKVTQVSFDLVVSRDNIALKCSDKGDYELPNKLPNILKSGYCTDPKYTFSLLSHGSEFALRVSHQTADAFGNTGTEDVPTYCKAGGLGPADLACSQIEPVVRIPIYGPFCTSKP